MKRIAIAAGLIGLAVVVSGCNTSAGDAGNLLKPSKAQMEQKYLSVVRNNTNVGSLNDDDLIELGHTVCDTIDKGVTIENVVTIALQSGLSANDAGTIVGASVGAFCPRHIAKVRQFADMYNDTGSA